MVSANGPDEMYDADMDDQSQESPLTKLKVLMEQAADIPPRTVGEKWYIISAKWMAQLKKHLEKGGGNDITNPGTIDNSALIDRVDGQNVLKEQMSDKEDYEFIPEDLWQKLVSTFGLSGDWNLQTLPVQVYETPNFELKIEARPLALEACVYDKLTDFVTVRVSRAYTIGECVNILLHRLNIQNGENIRVWLFTPDGQLETPDPVVTKSVNDLQLTIKHLVVVEEKSGVDFPLDGAEKKAELVRDLRKLRGVTPDVEMAGNQEDKDKSSGTRYFLRSTQTAFDSISSYSSSPNAQPGLVGLGNLGNTCFMNSSLQCLSNVPELTNYFLSKRYVDDINEDNPLGHKGEVAKYFADLVWNLWSKSSSFYPSRFKGILGRYTSLFNGSQQDAQESLQFIVDCLHEDLNRIKKKPYIVQDDENSGKSDQQLSKEGWANFQARNDSFIVDLFYGQIRSSVRCPDCTKISVTFDPVCYYSLPLPSNQTKKIPLTYVAFDERYGPELMKVMLPKNSTISDLLTRIADKRNIKADNLLAVDIWDHRVQNVLKKDSSISDITERDKTIVYQLPYTLNDPNYITVVVYIRKTRETTRTSSWISSAELFDYPFVLSVPVKGIGAKRLYHLVYARLRRHLKATEDSDDSARVPTMEENNENRQNGGGETSSTRNGAMGEDEDQENDTKLADSVDNSTPPGYLPQIFTLCTINQYGSTEIDSISVDQKKPVVFLKTREVQFLAVNFTEENANKMYQKEEMPKDTERKENVWSSSSKSPEAVELRDCFQLYISQEKLGENNMWRCPNCKEEKQAVKKLDFWKMPKYMFVHLKRFQYNRFYRDKLNTKVKFSSTGMDLSDLVINTAERPAVYDLVALSCHAGGLGGGHYWAVCKNATSKKWHKFDDSHVSDASESDIENETSPYILVFKRRTDGADPEPNLSRADSDQKMSVDSS